MSNDLWRWAAPDGQQRVARLDELRAALAQGLIAPNAPVWRAGWGGWRSAHDVPELTSSALAAANGVVPNIPPPPLAMVAVQHDFEAQGAAFAPPAPAPQGDEVPPPPPPYVPMPIRPQSIPPAAGSSGRLPSKAPPPGARASLPPGPASVRPRAPAGSLSAPTAIGLPPAPAMAAFVGGRRSAHEPDPEMDIPTLSNNALIEELSGSMLLTDSKPPAGSDGLPPPTDPVIRSVDSRRPPGGEGLVSLPPPPSPPLDAILGDLGALTAGRPPKNKLLLGVLAVLGLSLLIALLGLVVGLFRSASSKVAAGSTPRPMASASGAAAVPPAPPAASSAEAVAAAAETSAPAAPSTSREGGDCAAAGEPRVVSARAFGPAGVEAVALPSGIALGFAVDARIGQGMLVDPASVGTTASVKRALGGDVRRVTPILERGKLALAVGVDRKGDKLAGRRAAGTTPVVDLGVVDGALAWAPRDQSSGTRLFALEGEGTVDAIRAVPLASERGLALAFRRGNAVYLGVAKGEAALAPDGTLTSIAGLGQVGSPSLATSGDALVVAWSDRAMAQEPWQIRWTKITRGVAEAPRPLALPPGGPGVQAMSPSVAGLGGGRFLLAWSEGTPTHQVRALTVGADGVPKGSVLALSPPGVNAGQPQAAIGPDGRGVVAFLVARGKAYEVQATPVLCPVK